MINNFNKLVFLDVINKTFYSLKHHKIFLSSREYMEFTIIEYWSTLGHGKKKIILFYRWTDLLSRVGQWICQNGNSGSVRSVKHVFCFLLFSLFVFIIIIIILWVVIWVKYNIRFINLCLSAEGLHRTWYALIRTSLMLVPWFSFLQRMEEKQQNIYFGFTS